MKPFFAFPVFVCLSLLAGCATEPAQKPLQRPFVATSSSPVSRVLPILQTVHPAPPSHAVYRIHPDKQKRICETATQQLTSYLQYLVQHNEKIAMQCAAKNHHPACWNKLHQDLRREEKSIKILGSNQLCTPQEHVYHQSARYLHWSKEVAAGCALTGTKTCLSSLAAQKAMEARREMLSTMRFFG